MNIKSIQSKTLADTVHKRLTNAITSGEIPPGEHLTIQKLAKEFNVSMMPIREAVRKLEAEKFISINKQRRITVNQLSKENIDDLYEIRIILETYAAKKACKSLDGKIIQKLERYYESLVSAKDNKSIMKANKNFHFTIYRQAGLPILVDMINLLWEKISPYLFLYFKKILEAEDEQTLTIFYENHNKLLDAVRHKDQEQIISALKKDLTEGRELIISIVENLKSFLKIKSD